MTYILLGLFLWYVSGCASFIYWWTSEFPFTKHNIVLCVLMGLAGPTAFLMGWDIHSRHKHINVLIKKRSLK